jgi:transcriptional regulator GlxA family with amidase domain
MSTRDSLTVGIFIFDDVEVLDFCGPLEVFSVSGAAGSPTPGAFSVKLIAETLDPIATRGKMRVLPDYTLTDHPPLDILLVPGGPGTRRDIHNPRVIEWIARSEPRVALTSICTGALLLAEAGRLDNLEATTHAGSHDWLAQYERVTLRPEARFVDNGFVLTSAGVSAGIDMALHLVERLVGAETAAWTAQVMEYDPRPATPSTTLP